MAETAKCSVETEVGCGFVGTFFPLRGFRQRKSVLFRDTSHSKRHQDSSKSAKPQMVLGEKPAPVAPRPSNCREKCRGARVSDAARISNSSLNCVGGSHKSSQAVNLSYTRRITKEPTFNSSELSLTIADQRKFDNDAAHYRGSTGNVMLLGHLGNLKQQGKRSKTDARNNGIKGNIVVKKPVEIKHQLGNIFSRNELNPDVIKSLGNEKYKEGKYEEALALYHQAIAIDPSKACYYSNKSAALMGLGRLVEAVLQCREAVRIDSSYHNAHFRLAKLYLRLGVAEKAIHHYKWSGCKAGPKDIAQAQALKTCINRCSEAQNSEDWNKLLDESQIALSLGADSAPQIFAMKAEAMMQLHRHQEANDTLLNIPHLSNELYVEFFGSSIAAGLLVTRAQVYVANGRFEDAVATIQHALELDPSSRVKLAAERVKCVASARSNGNRLFKASRITEALTAYNVGLEKDPYNSVLLCNRAACRSKLGQYEKAVEDCTAALVARPSYRKARLRRANCNAELEKWEGAVQDYEVLLQENSGDKEVKELLLEAKMQLDCVSVKTKDNVSNIAINSSKKQFTHLTTTPG